MVVSAPTLQLLEWSDELVLAALAAENRAPEAVGILGEDVVQVGGLDDPVVALELVLELLRAPACDAGEHARALELRCAVLESVVQRDGADVLDHHDAGLVRIVKLG